jgi:hypothetical protein
MTEDKFSEYTQKLYDTVLSLRVEVDNLRKGYSIIHQRIDEIATQADKSTAEALKEAINIEELSRLVLVASTVAHQSAVLINDIKVVDSTHKTVLAADDAYKTASLSTISSQNRQTPGGVPGGGGRIKKPDSTS